MAACGSRILGSLLFGALVFACASEDRDLPEGGAGSSAAGAAGHAGSPNAGGAGGLAVAGGAGAGGSAGALGASAASGRGGAPAGVGGSRTIGGAGMGGSSEPRSGSSGLGGAGGTLNLGGSAGTGGSAGNASAGTAGLASGDPKIVLVAGSGKGGDGTPATDAAVPNPYGAVVDPITGDVFIAEVDTGRIRRIDQTGIITTVVGPGAPGAAADIELNQPHDLLFQPGTSTLFIADTMNGNVYRYDAAGGEVLRLVGAGAPFPGVSRVYCLAFSPSGTELYYTGPDDIRVIDLMTMTAKQPVDYPAARVIAIDSEGTLYAVKNRPNGDALQVVDAAGNVTDMPATLNVVSDPKHIAIDRDDNVLIADTELQLVRSYDVTGDSLVTLVGDGMTGTGTLGGAPQNAQVRRPHGVFEDPKTGAIYVSDSENDRVLKIAR